MSHSKKKKIQGFYISAKDLADNLRTFADKLEGGHISIEEEEFSLALDTLIKVSLKSKGDKVSLKMKSKLLKSLEDINKITLNEEKEAIEAKNVRKGNTASKAAIHNEAENYKALKKRMTQDIKILMKKCIKEQSLPDPSLIERFYRDSLTMCNYTDKGDYYYKTYLKQVEMLYQSFKNSDLKSINSAISSLDRIKKECHSKYK